MSNYFTTERKRRKTYWRVPTWQKSYYPIIDKHIYNDTLGCVSKIDPNGQVTKTTYDSQGCKIHADETFNVAGVEKTRVAYLVNC
jgi:hypothetical protein